MPTGLVGWAAQGGGTTGGAGGSTVTVTSWADFRTQAQASGARTILVSGMLSGSGTVEITANKTIRGVGAARASPAPPSTSRTCRRPT